VCFLFVLCVGTLPLATRFATPEQVCGAMCYAQG
jgi:hypothetical protein